MGFLPVNREDMRRRGWEKLDFLLISGDAYVDHPSFGHAIISRVLENAGYRVGIIAQPDWKKPESINGMGVPELGVLITSGVIDSMVNHYTSFGNKRRRDRYSPGDKTGKRPDRALITYTGMAKHMFKGVPVIIGGVEAGLRRFAHYDFWDDSVRRSILFDSKADLLVYGPGEKAILEIAERLQKGRDTENIPGTAYISRDIPEGSVKLHSYDEVSKDKRKFAEAFRVEFEEQDPVRGRTLHQAHGDRFLICMPPAMPLDTDELDRVYSLPYEREYHPSYEKAGGVKAIEEVKFSITSHRGCPGGCNFCSIVFHQGRIVTKRSKESILDEVRMLSQKEDFKGYITDIGGPTANFRDAVCLNAGENGMCAKKQCLYPGICPNLKVDHSEYLDILREARQIKGVKKIFVKSGVRYDYLISDKNNAFLADLCKHHISGQLKVAPEHASKKVLGYMGKADADVYRKFKKMYDETNRKLGKRQYLVPYFIIGHPGEEMEDVIELVELLMETGFVPDQVQDFYPTPGTVSTCMYHSGYDPRTMEQVKTVKDTNEKRDRRILVQFSKRGNGRKARQILISHGRQDLASRVRNN